MPRWFLVVSAVAGIGFAVPTVQAAAAGDVRTVVVGVIVTGFSWWPLVTWLRYRRDPVDPGEPDGLPPEDLTARGARRWLLPVVLLVVRFRTGVEKHYPWADVLELSWSAPHWLMSGSGPVARVRGNAYDTPGPTSPAQLAAVLLAGHDHRLWGRKQVRRAAARHGIPFTDDLVTLVGSGRRPARLPGEHS
ncbi:hypothetical protein ACFEMC_22205 [Kineococcus sp. DHX-1]|uniref:hypothetical protein n=1 Tax=Kineococcus sp. DHX-1 TaxID=3349638 RepID=UPI0036D2C966